MLFFKWCGIMLEGIFFDGLYLFDFCQWFLMG